MPGDYLPDVSPVDAGDAFVAISVPISTMIALVRISRLGIVLVGVDANNSVAGERIVESANTGKEVDEGSFR